AIDQASTPGADLLNEVSLTDQENEILEPDGPVDTSFNTDEFNQSLFDELDQPDPTVDRLTTGEEQPRLPGAEDVRSQEQPTPQVAEAPFSLTSEIAKPRAGKNRELFQTVYHGTPHVFEQFSLHAIGSGEGNHSYGWGLYFTSTKEIAEKYRDALAGETYTANGRPLERESERGEQDAAAYAAEEVTRAKRGEISEQYWQGVKDSIAALRGQTIERKSTGHVVTAEIPDDENMLDYDKPASQQPPKVQEALRALGVKWNQIDPPTVKEAMRTFRSHRIAVAAAEDIGIRETLREGLYYATAGNQTAFDAWYAKHLRAVAVGRAAREPGPHASAGGRGCVEETERRRRARHPLPGRQQPDGRRRHAQLRRVRRSPREDRRV